MISDKVIDVRPCEVEPLVKSGVTVYAFDKLMPDSHAVELADLPVRRAMGLIKSKTAVFWYLRSECPEGMTVKEALELHHNRFQVRIKPVPSETPYLESIGFEFGYDSASKILYHENIFQEKEKYERLLAKEVKSYGKEKLQNGDEITTFYCY